MNWIRGGALLLTGIAVGASGTYIFLKKKFGKTLEDTVAEIKSAYSNCDSEPSYVTENETEDVGDPEAVREMINAAREKPNITDYANMYKSSGEDIMDFGSYVAKANDFREAAKEEIEHIEEVATGNIPKADRHLFDDDKEETPPYIIDDDTLLEKQAIGYDKTFMIFYKDAILAYRDGTTVSDVESKISKSLLASFLGDPTKLTINVCNDSIGVVYIIEKSTSKYESIMDEPSEEDSD